jgi:hypothetical protein
MPTNEKRGRVVDFIASGVRLANGSIAALGGMPRRLLNS